MLGIDAVLQRLPNGAYDIQIGPDGDILTEDTFDTAIIVSLLTDARADESEVLESHQRRGWIGNEVTPDFEIGSKLWLFDQSKLTATVMNQVADAAQDGLQWFVDDDLLVAISTEVTVTVDSIRLVVNLQRENGMVDQRFFELWQKTGVS